MSKRGPNNRHDTDPIEGKLIRIGHYLRKLYRRAARAEKDSLDAALETGCAEKVGCGRGFVSALNFAVNRFALPHYATFVRQCCVVAFVVCRVSQQHILTLAIRMYI
jgi:hypothetical protein